MARSREIANTPHKRRTRYLLYKDLIDQYKIAMSEGFYLEAITLMESLITDRLESALIYYGKNSPDQVFLPLGNALSPFKDQGIISDQLYDRIDYWRKARNQALHEMAKIEEGTTPVFRERYAIQQVIARDGYEIFKSLKEELR